MCFEVKALRSVCSFAAEADGLQSGSAGRIVNGVDMKPRAKRSTGRIELGEYIVADPEICHGQPTFKGTRVLVWVVLEQLADGMSWNAIVKEWRGRVPKAAIAEAAALASELVKQRGYRGLNDHYRRKPARVRDLATA